MEVAGGFRPRDGVYLKPRGSGDAPAMAPRSPTRGDVEERFHGQHPPSGPWRRGREGLGRYRCRAVMVAVQRGVDRTSHRGIDAGTACDGGIHGIANGRRRTRSSGQRRSGDGGEEVTRHAVERLIEGLVRARHVAVPQPHGAHRIPRVRATLAPVEMP